MSKSLALLFSISLVCSAANIETFYSESGFDSAVNTGSFQTETFSGDQINTSGLTISGCYSPSYPSTAVRVCAPLSAAELNGSAGLHYQLITGDQFTDAVGRDPKNPYSGFFGVNDFTTLFTLPQSVTALAFDVNEQTTLGSNFGVSLGGAIQYPFGGTYGSNTPFPGLPMNGYSYDGFVGFVSDTPFDTVELSAFYSPGVAYQLDNFSFGDPVTLAPEPLPLPLICAGLLLIFGARKRRPAL